MKILVTGGTGYVGSCVTQILSTAGHNVTVLSRKPGPKTVVADIRDRDRIIKVAEQTKPEAIVHLAALTRNRESFEKPLEYFDVNLNGTLNLLYATKKLAKPVRFIFSSTNVVYGPRYEGAISEDFDCFPEGPYAVSKFAAEKLIQSYAATGAIIGVTLRFLNVSGAYKDSLDLDTTRIIPNTFRAITGQLPYVTLNGDGSAMRDFVHVKDVAQAITTLLSAKIDQESNYDCFNVGSGVGTSMSSVIDMVQQVTGYNVPVVNAQKKPEPQRLIADITRLTSFANWKPVSSDLKTIIQDSWAAWQKLYPLKSEQ